MSEEKTETLFDQLWRNHPSLQATPDTSPCKNKDGAANFENQCAIRMGVCLSNAGISLASFRGACCWHNHGRKHFLRAEEMMLWLNRKGSPFGAANISKRDKNGLQKSATDYAGKRGIVVFRNFWGSNNQGDHIDLWDGANMAQGNNSYFNKSQEIWFWEMD
ncbi:type VI secretion system amidase effector protein Tae4 [Massilia sp. W12]|uniref:type VI secretion system amidase effector protein Tae4 n=1 Tax=Massilia sp. W12 TaxID=3126507 RepID=UPI0030CDEA61